ncbi:MULTISPECIES: Fic family protein [unclassified Mycobacterium]|uniref:Fic family protein n=1 Tax=unclassified Mycobacterium TaxID=2642494 RepID=UPI0029C5FD07|nr:MULTISPECIES: Fic/DOC family N-terminal domain-containing protein [unclassified Mycobacterium]
MSEADAALGRLAGAGRLLPDPHLLVNAYITREAVASSRIEGTQASVTEVFDAAVSGTSTRADVQEVRNYILALEHGLARLAEFPISLRLIREMHEILLTGVRGQERTPGEFRQTQNWISSPDNQPRTARFVPPTVDNMWAALNDWEKCLHDKDPKLPLLVRCALMHYQFETIHPFLDGNGRIGRLFIILYLLNLGRLPTPLLYISSYFEQRKEEYYDRLQFVRERGEIEEWLNFFLAGIAGQAADAVTRAEELADLREHYRIALQGSRSRAIEVADLLFANPIMTVRAVQTRLDMSQPGATNLLRTLTSAGIVREIGEGPGTRHRWIADDILRVLDP